MVSAAALTLTIILAPFGPLGLLPMFKPGLARPGKSFAPPSFFLVSCDYVRKWSGARHILQTSEP